MRQKLTVIFLSQCIATTCFAQAPALPLPPLPAPGAPISNFSNDDNPATTPELEFGNLKGPEEIARASAPQKATTLPNPADLLPQDFLPDAAEPISNENFAPPPAITPPQEEESQPPPDLIANPPLPPQEGTKTQAGEPARQTSIGNLHKETVNPPPPSPAITTRSASTTNTSLPVPPFTPLLPADAPLASISAIKEQGGKSWDMPLKPARSYPKTTFNYRHVELPGAIYQAHYNRSNQHLPLKRTTVFYDELLIRAAAQNDINGLRALLQSGANINKINAMGDSALIIALQHSATATAQLLIAKGANIDYIGSGGKSAFFYANRLGSPELVKLLTARNGESS